MPLKASDQAAEKLLSTVNAAKAALARAQEVEVVFVAAADLMAEAGCAEQRVQDSTSTRWRNSDEHICA